MLIEEEFPDGVTTGYESPVKQLFIPLLRQASTYDVAVGYFTSGWLRDTAEGLAEFALSGGKCRWIVSPSLNEEDANIIVDTVSRKDGGIEYQERQLIDTIKALKKDARAELCALIAAEIIEFRIAEPKDFTTQGMLHAKIGVAADSSGNRVGFSGSYNLTARAKFNWERGEESRIERLQGRFENLWTNNDPSYEIYKPSRELIEFIRTEAGVKLGEFLIKRKRRNRKQVEFRDYQLEAIENWGRNNGRGTFVMATGSGKTITALGTIDRLIDKIVKSKNRPLVIVIVLPLKHLLDQWHGEAASFGLDSIKCYESSSTWKKKLSERLAAISVTNEGYIIALVTNVTFSMENFQNFIQKIESDFLIVADEAHNLGSPTYLDALPENANFRLALSATPERHNDVFGTRSLFEYFGKAVIEFDLSDAIDAGFLCPYKYHAHLCPMSDSEYEDYLELSQLIQGESSKRDGGGIKSKEQLRLEGKRADLITRVESKLEKLSELLKIQEVSGGVNHTLVYCGSRRGENSERHIERTIRLIGGLGIKVRKFTSGESTIERKEILDLFSKGELEAIAAIKCLDEGVDVPQTRVAYILASTTNPREYIQRRGRVLRKAENKEYAIIHDFLVAPPPHRSHKTDLVDRELARAREFSMLALNRNECESVLNELSIVMESCSENT